MESAGGSGFPFYKGWSEVPFWMAFVEETWKKWLMEGRVFPETEGSECAKTDLEAKVFLKQKWTGQCGSSNSQGVCVRRWGPRGQGFRSHRSCKAM